MGTRGPETERHADSHATPRSDLVKLVQGFYLRAGLEVGDDPGDLAEALGFDPCPSSCPCAHLDGTLLRYPEHMLCAARGMAIFPILALLLATAAHLIASPEILATLTDELILPELLARRIGFGSLQAIQPYASFEALCRIFMGCHASGSMPAVS